MNHLTPPCGSTCCPVLTTSTVCFFANDGDWTEHPAPNRARRYIANSDTCLFRLYKVPCGESTEMDRGPDEQIQFRAGATILGCRAPRWEWERPGARRILFIFDEADVIARPRAPHPEETYDACYRDNPQMWS
jgi:hypothetical protein